MNTKSPFYVVEEFLSPLLCEDILDSVDFTVPNSDKDGRLISTKKSCQPSDMVIFERLQPMLAELQAYYKVQYKGTEPMLYEWYPSGASGRLGAENSEFLRQKWVRMKPADLTAVIFLSDYQDSQAFDSDFEVYGGKLEFPQHQFSINPKRGTLVVYPSDPHFINQTGIVMAGSLYQIRIQIVCKSPYFYNPEEFPGNYRSWFANHL